MIRTVSPSRTLTLPSLSFTSRSAAIARPADTTPAPATAAGSGGSSTPASVKMAVTSSAGVTSNAGLAADCPGTNATSPGSRSSIGIAAPSGVEGSTVDRGAAT